MLGQLSTDVSPAKGFQRFLRQLPILLYLLTYMNLHDGLDRRDGNLISKVKR